jgi:nonsense-mediated mRNA decay protein 3
MQATSITTTGTTGTGTTSGGGTMMMTVLCCMCGVPITPNAANTCATCLASSADITRGISTEATLHQCRGCQRWHKEGGTKWIACELESRELMALCLSHVSGLSKNLNTANGGKKKTGALNKEHNNTIHKIRLVDAGWIWTEPHSMRLKVRLTIQREVQAGTILQQSFTVTFIVRNQQCIECQAEFRQGSWKSLVQVRQRVAHKRTFLYLEQLILRHGAHRGCLSIEAFKDGMDFYFPNKSAATRFYSFLENVTPTKMKQSKKLISTDDKSNIANYKYTNYVEICPLCKDDLLYLPSKTARKMGNIAQLVLVKNISNVLHFIDPLTGQRATMTPDAYWRDPIRPIITAARSRMTRFVVLGKEPVYLRQNVSKRHFTRKQQTKLARVTLARESDLGVNDKQFEEVSHIGYLLKAGDVCYGYDLQETQFVDDAAETMRNSGNLPSVIIVRKLYGGAATGDPDVSAAKQRIWRLERLPVAVPGSGEDEVEEQPQQQRSRKPKKAELQQEDMDEEDFMQEVEADGEMRMGINLYKNQVVQKMTSDHAGAMDITRSSKHNNGDDYDEEEDDEDDQQVRLDELLDGLALQDAGPDPDDDDVDGGGGGGGAFAGAGRAAGGPFDGNDDYIGLPSLMTVVTEGEKAAKDGITYISRQEARQVRDKDAAVTVVELGKDFTEDLDL